MKRISKAKREHLIQCAEEMSMRDDFRVLLAIARAWPRTTFTLRVHIPATPMVIEEAQ